MPRSRPTIATNGHPICFILLLCLCYVLWFLCFVFKVLVKVFTHLFVCLFVWQIIDIEEERSKYFRGRPHLPSGKTSPYDGCNYATSDRFGRFLGSAALPPFVRSQNGPLHYIRYTFTARLPKFHQNDGGCPSV